MTKLDIINTALMRLGETPIQSLDEESTPAKTAKLLYDFSRRAILRDSDWNFAMREVTLAVVEPGVPAGYALPSDCLRAIGVKRIAGECQVLSEWFRVQGDKLYTYASAPRLVYIRDEEDVTLFDPKFIEAFTYKLAGEMAMPVKQSESLTSAMLNAYQGVLMTASTETQNEHHVPLSENPYVEVRNA